MSQTFDRKRAFEGVRNFRDFGGYQAGDRRMASGRFFRSAHHALASDDDLVGLAGMKIGAVIDLRRPEERERMPSRRWSGFETTLLIENHDDDEGAGNESWAGFMESWDLSDTGIRNYHHRYYERAPTLPRLLDLYSRYFKAIAETDGPVVVHCAAGKDRTGVIVALTQHLAGVHHDDIVADYLLTNESNGFETHGPLWAKEIEAQRGRAPDMSVMRIAMSVEAEYLDRAFAVIKARYGSIDNYYSDALGIDAKLRAAIEKRLFE